MFSIRKTSASAARVAVDHARVRFGDSKESESFRDVGPPQSPWERSARHRVRREFRQEDCRSLIG